MSFYNSVAYLIIYGFCIFKNIYVIKHKCYLTHILIFILIGYFPFVRLFLWRVIYTLKVCYERKKHIRVTSNIDWRLHSLVKLSLKSFLSVMKVVPLSALCSKENTIFTVKLIPWPCGFQNMVLSRSWYLGNWNKLTQFLSWFEEIASFIAI